MVGFEFQNGIEAVSKFDFERSRRREESHSSSIERHEAKERAAHVDGRNESGMGLPHSKTLSRRIARHSLREVLECGCPLPLWAPFVGGRNSSKTASPPPRYLGGYEV